MDVVANNPPVQTTVSKSGPIRQLINPTIARLVVYLDDVANSDPRVAVDPAVSLEDNISALENQAYWLGNAIKKITGAVEMLKSQNAEWLSLIRSLAGDELKTETILYEQFSNENNSFILVMTHGIEALDMLDSRLLEVENTIKRLKNGSQNMLAFVPNPQQWTGQPTQTMQASNAIRVQLPKLQLPIYQGDPLKWIEFWDAFEAAVHKQEIPDVQKFNYLLSTLKGSAYKAIEGMAITNANYKDAIEILMKRFGDPNVIKRALYSELRNLPMSTGKTVDLRHTLEGIDRVCRQLKSLNEDLKQPTLVMLIQEKLPSHILMELGRQKKPDEMWQVDKLREELNNIVRIKEEAFQVLQNTSTRDRNERKTAQFNNKYGYQSMQHSSAEAFPTITSESRPTFQHQKKPKFFPCAFCQGNHLNDQCSVCQTLESRKKKVKESNLCFRCLRPGHMANQCSFTRPCSYCRGNHNTALCAKYEPNSLQFGQEKELKPVAKLETYATVAKIYPNEIHTKNETCENKDENEKFQHNVINENKDKAKLCQKDEKHLQETTATATLPVVQNEIILLTAKVKVVNTEKTNTKERPLELQAFFDNGSQRTFVTNTLVERLKLKTNYQEMLSLNTFAATKPTTLKTARVSVGILLKNGEVKHVEANAVPKLTENLKTASLSKDDLLFLKGLQNINACNISLAESESVKPDILIGADYFWEFLENEKPKKLPSGMFLIESKVGPLISGKQNESSKENDCIQTVTPAVVLEQGIILEKEDTVSPEKRETKSNICQSVGDLEAFWGLETIGIKDSPEIKDDDIALANFNNTVCFKDGRYEVKWPWKSTDPELPDNYGLAFGRLKSLLNRFQQDRELLCKYNEIMQDQLSKGIIEKIDENSLEGPLKHYLPHHPVITPQKTTTKVRVVYDASAKSGKGKNSLNDCLFRGPILMPDLCGLLIRFRMAPIGIMADVEKAFLQIALQIPDRDVTRFLWFSDPTNPSLEMIQVYRFCRVTFGVISSPFLLNATLLYHLQKSGSEVASQIAKNTYVDNVLIGAKSKEEATKIYKEAKSLFQNASMNLREWASNSKAFCEEIEETDRLKESTTKILGLKWDTNFDTLQIIINSENDRGTGNELTKRKILHQLASTFDPLGLLAPVLLKAKKLLQVLWEKKLDWDQELPQEYVDMWQEIVKDWKANNVFFINRCIPHVFFEPEYQLVTFVDASKIAYAAAVYLRTKSNESVTTQLIFAKSRLAPIKVVSLPRLELLAAVIGGRATKFVQEQIGVPIMKKTIFSDSECVLHWLKSAKPFPVFVSNRVKELHQMKEVNFQYISTEENPADVGTRGITAEAFVNFDLWWSGPKWLKLPPEEWPVGNLPVITQKIIEEVTEKESPQVFHEATLAVTAAKPVLDLQRMPSAGKASRIVAYVLRLLKIKIWNRCTTKPKITLFDNINLNGELTAKEIDTAKKVLIKQAQHQCYSELFDLEKKTKNDNLKTKLGIQVDKNGLLRCYGRLNKADVSDDTKYPVLLPKKSRITELIILDKHKALFHAGVNHTLSSIRFEYWIPKGRVEVKRMLHNCLVCHKYRVGPYQLPKMPPFPPERVNRARPFQFIGLDYLGPLAIKEGENKRNVWVCLFTCLVTRAIHLEIVIDLSAKTFLNCVRRFIARRGKPDKIISDNAGQFKLVNRLIDNVWNSVFKEPSTTAYFAMQKIDWHYITEFAPWQGGFYERLIGLVKRSLRKTLGRQLLILEEMNTLLIEIEAVLNSRPLTYVSNDTEEGHALRPVDLLIPEGEIGITEDFEINDETIPRSNSMQDLKLYWKSSSKNLDEFWKIWVEEYLLSLRERTQNTHKGPRIQTHDKPNINDIVLVKGESPSRGVWKLGKIVEFKVSTDNEIRTAKVQLSNKILVQRPINLLYPLEITTTHQDDEETSGSDTVNTNVVVCKLQNKNAIYNKLLKNPLLGISLIFLIFLSLSFVPVSLGQQVGSACKFDDILVTVHSQYCVKGGIVVKRTKDSKLCWLRIDCPVGHLNKKGVCAEKCSCPEWADGCSAYNGKTPSIIGKKEQILALSLPLYCSLKPDPNCNNQSTHSKWHQIQLYDNTVHFVKNLEIVAYTPLSEDFVCVGKGPQVGTPQFCENHKCESSGTRFCYYPQNELVKFINEDGEIPIKAWGSKMIEYYGPKEILLQNPICQNCSIECIHGGAKIKLENNIGVMEICSSPFCYKISHPKQVEEIQFPKDVEIYSHEFTVKLWSNGYLVKDFGTQCPAAPYCEMINCYLCWPMLGNPQCAPKSFLIIFFVLVYIFAGAIYFLLQAAGSICKACYYCSYFMFQCLKLFQIMGKRARNKIYRNITPILESSNPRQGLPTTLTSERIVNHENSRFQYRPSPKTYTLVTTVVVTLIFCFGLAKACSEVVTLTAQKSVCTSHENGSMECILTEATRLALVPQGQDACLLIKDPNGEPVGTMAVEVQKVTIACQVKNEYFTRSFKMKVESSKRCPNMGSCVGEKCGKIKTDTKVDELKGEANDSPGFTHCVESCGCAACGCFYCTSACMFYRTYASPATDTVYEIFSCPVWEYNVKVTVRLNLQKENIQQSFELKPGIAVEWKNLKLALPSISTPPVPILGSQFLTDGVKTVMIRASASGQPVSGTVGEMQCASREKATNFDCYLPHDSCQCQSHEKQVSCNCAERTLENLFSKIEYVLPMTSQGISISGTGTNIQAEYNKIAALELQVMLEGFRLATKVDKNKCEIKLLEFGGCYSCFTGAKLKFECKTNFGEALAHVTCGIASFSTTCTPQGVTAIATLNFPHASIKETCNVNCPAGLSTFQLEATLVFIEKERLGNLTNVISAKNEGGGIDLGFLAGWLSGNWLASIPIIIGAILLIVLTIMFFPPLLKCIIASSQKMGTNIRGKISNKYTNVFKRKQPKYQAKRL